MRTSLARALIEIDLPVSHATTDGRRRRLADARGGRAATAGRPLTAMTGVTWVSPGPSRPTTKR